MPPALRPTAVVFVSAGTLAYQILLVRVFAIEQFYHFAYMAIGVAMLGFGASGTLIALAGRLEPTQAARWYRWSAAAVPILLVASAVLVDMLPLDATQLLWSRAQWFYVAVLYTLLALPFGAGALVVLLALQMESDRPGRIYGASFLGSGLGALLALGVLWIATPVRALALPAIVTVFASVAVACEYGARRSLRLFVGATILAAVAVAFRPPWKMDVSPYKGLPQVEAYPDAQRILDRSSPLGWVVAVDAPAFRHAPGLSLAYSGEVPPQTGLFVDGQLVGAVPRLGIEPHPMADWLPSAVPYQLGEAARVLVLFAGGGSEVGSALAHDAGHVTAVEFVPDLVRLAESRLSGGGRGTENDRVAWVVQDARSFVARTSERYDLVVVGPSGGPGGAAAGVHALNEDFTHTVEAYAAYLDLLDDGGILTITRWLANPPRVTVRTILTAAESLRRSAPRAVRAGMIVLRSWATVTVLVRPSGFTEEDVAVLLTWADEREFDIDWYPGLRAPESKYHRIAEPTLFRAARAGVSGTAAAERFSSTYPFDVTPATDARPYPQHFLRPSGVRSLLAFERGSWLPFAELGYVVLLATLVQSALLAAVLLVVPVVVRARFVAGAGLPEVIIYFAAIGFGYLAVEVAIIQQLGLLLGHPVYAVVAVLTGLLVGSGIGSIISDRLPATRVSIAAASVAFMVGVAALFLLPLVHLTQPAPVALRVVAAMGVVVPLAFLMGLPFPLGIRMLVAAEHHHLPWAWAANGFASVVAAPLAALAALELGTPSVLVLAAVAYASAAVVSRRRSAAASLLA